MWCGDIAFSRRLESNEFSDQKFEMGNILSADKSKSAFRALFLFE